jgi:hypothetical protein
MGDITPFSTPFREGFGVNHSKRLIGTPFAMTLLDAVFQSTG